MGTGISVWNSGDEGLMLSVAGRDIRVVDLVEKIVQEEKCRPAGEYLSGPIRVQED